MAQASTPANVSTAKAPVSQEVPAALEGVARAPPGLLPPRVLEAAEAPAWLVPAEAPLAPHVPWAPQVWRVPPQQAVEQARGREPPAVA